jgi:CheY-like chemotaxis protein
MEHKSNFIILMADDDDDDCSFAREAFLECCDQVSVGCVLDGVELMEYLTEHSRDGSDGLPRLILLDLNMPRKDGRQTLVEIKAEPTFKEIPVVIFTTSSEEKDNTFAMKSGANLFLTKPASFDEWVNTMRSLTERWIK